MAISQNKAEESFDIQAQDAKPSFGQDSTCNTQNWWKLVDKKNKTKAEKGFGLLAWATKPSETRVVHWGGQSSMYFSSPLLLNFSERDRYSSRYATIHESLETKKKGSLESQALIEPAVKKHRIKVKVKWPSLDKVQQ